MAGAALSLMLSAGILFALFMMARLAWRQLRQPVLHADSWYFTERGGGSSLEWLFRQHNEHRQVFSKLSNLIETELLRIPPMSTALMQSFMLLLLCLGLLVLICRSVVVRRRLQWFTWLSTGLLILNPWQWESLAWEFQSPWLLINALTLLSTLLLIHGKAQGRDLIRLVVLASIPWVAIFNNGSGFLLAAALCLCTLWFSRREAFVVVASSLIATLVYFPVLHYRSPWGEYTRYGFDLDFFSRLLLGGPWQGLAFLLVLLIPLLLLALPAASFQGRAGTLPSRTSDTASRRILVALSLPGIFSLLFTLFTTFARSPSGIHYSDYSYYVSHTLMLPVSLVLLFIYVVARDGRPEPDNAVTAGSTSLGLLWIAPSVLVLLTTVLSFPQVLTRNAPSFREAWMRTSLNRQAALETLVCFARTAARNPGGPPPARSQCAGGPSEGDRQMIDRYFRGRNSVHPMGWHDELLRRED